MSAYALDLGDRPKPAEPSWRPDAPPPPPPPPPALEPVCASPDDMKRPRFVQAIFTCLSLRRAPLTIGPTRPQAALARVLDEVDRHPRKVSVCCNRATLEDIEIRDESKPGEPRLLLAIVHAGLTLAEAQTALVALQSNPSPKGR
jgi:hypothetical protein